MEGVDVSDPTPLSPAATIKALEAEILHLKELLSAVRIERSKAMSYAAALHARFATVDAIAAEGQSLGFVFKRKPTT